MKCPRCGSANDPSEVTCTACGAAMARAGALAEGFMLASRYEILRAIGAGGMGVVYEARDHVLEEDVAIKVLRPEIAGHPDMARRFRQEIKLARRVRHRNVCGIHEYGEVGDLRFIAMEYVRGVNLRKVLHDGGALEPLEAFSVSAQVAKGLQAIHDAGVIHRDLKTSNIMRDSSGVVRVMDFGIAKQLGSEVTLAGIGPGLIVGTPEYMSPEQARADTVDIRSDIYSLGVVIYEIFTGTVPFRGDTPIATLLMHMSEPPPLTGPDAPVLPELLVPVLAKALAKMPGDRYGAARELLAAIRSAQVDTAHQTAPVREPLVASVPIVTAHEPLAASLSTAGATEMDGLPSTEVDGLPSTEVDDLPSSTEVDGLPTIRSANADPNDGAARARRPHRWLPVTGAVALMALFAGGLAWTKRETHRPAAAPPPTAVTSRGTIVVDALPWGEVERIVDGEGRSWPVGADRYTPFVASLPPGDYVISLRHPDVAETASVRVTVRASRLERRVVALREIDVDEYLQKAGF
jgi:serine/threonine protein kinase